MKKYIILKNYKCFNAQVVRDFDNLDDARMFRNLLAKSDDKPREYLIVEVLE